MRKNKENRGSRRDIPRRNITMIEIGIGAVLIAVFILLYIWYNTGLSTFSPGKETYQYHVGTKIEYSNNASFYNGDQDSDKIKVTDNDIESDVLKTPLITASDDEKELTLTCDMELFVPEESLTPKKILTFTKITNFEKRITYSRDGKTAQSYGGFLYDGADIYVFLENTMLRIGETEYKLGPLSYVRCVYNQQVEFFDSITCEDKVIGLGGPQVMAYCESGYSFNLGTDILYCNNSEYIIHSSLDNVNPIEME